MAILDDYARSQGYELDLSDAADITKSTYPIRAEQNRKTSKPSSVIR